MSFLKNIGRFNKEKEEKLIKEKKVKKFIYKQNNKILQIKKLLIRYLSLNIEKIKKNKLESNTDLPIKNDEILKDIQLFIFNKNQRLKEFYEKKNSLIFKNIELKYSTEFITDIYPKQDIWDCKYEKVIEYSKYNGNVIYDLLLYILTDELNNLINQVKTISTIEGETYSTNEAASIMAKFIINLFDIFMQDEEELRGNSEDLSKLENARREEYRIKYIKENMEMLDYPPELWQMKKGYTEAVDSVKESIELENQNIELDKKMDAKLDSAKSKASKALGDNASEYQINEFADSYINSEFTSAQEEQNQFTFSNLKEGYEVVETDINYGQLPQGINDEGDDMIGDYFEDNDIGYLPKRL